MVAMYLSNDSAGGATCAQRHARSSMQVDPSPSCCCPSFEHGVLPTACVLHRSDVDRWEELREVNFHQVRISRLQDKLLHSGIAIYISRAMPPPLWQPLYDSRDQPSPSCISLRSERHPDDAHGARECSPPGKGADTIESLVGDKLVYAQRGRRAFERSQVDPAIIPREGGAAARWPGGRSRAPRDLLMAAGRSLCAASTPARADARDHPEDDCGGFGRLSRTSVSMFCAIFC